MPATDNAEVKVRTPSRRDAPALGLAALLAVAASTHFVLPASYDGLIPSFLGPPRPWVLGSGVLEMLCAVGVAVPRTRRPAAWATAGLFVAVFPGNVTMAVDTAGHGNLYRALTYARLPLQVPLVLWAVSVARRAGRPS